MHILQSRRAVAFTAKGLVVVVAVAGMRTEAQDAEWINPTPPPGPFGFLAYGTNSNWDTGNAPTLADDALFQIDLMGNPIVLSAGSQSNNLTVAANAWNFSGFTGGDLTTAGVALIDDVSATSLATGASLNLSDNALWNIADAALTNDNDLLVGQQGFGTLGIQTNSDVTAENIFVGNSAGAVGVVNVDGVGSTLTAVRTDSQGRIINIGGDGGTGTVNLTNGGQLLTTNAGGSANQDIVVGRSFFDADPVDPANPVVRSVGTLNVSGAGSLAETSDFLVGHLGGIGTVNILDGGQVVLAEGASPQALFGSGEGSVGNGTIDGTDSVLRAHAVFVGTSGGTGQVAVTNGGELITEITAQATDSTNEGDLIIGNTNAPGAIANGLVAVYGTDGTTSSAVNADSIVIVGSDGLGELRVGRDLNGNFQDFGQVNAAQIIVGDLDNNDQDNRVVVDGANAQVQTSGAITVGDAGRGIWEAFNGSTTTAGAGFNVGVRDGSVSTALFDGTGTTLTAFNLFVGNGTGVGSTGTATFRNGATATLNGAFATNDGGSAVTIGDDDEGLGTLNIEGVGSRVETTNSTWFIGGSENEDGGTGTVNISAGGVGIASGRTWIGYRVNAQGTLNVTGSGSHYDANGDFILVGFQGDGFLNIDDGGVVNGNGLILADEPGSAGSDITVDGAGSQLNLTQRLFIGDENDATMTVSDGAVVNVASNFADPDVADRRLVIGRINSSNDSSLTVTGDGSAVNYFGGERISVGFQAGTTADRNKLHVLDGAVVRAFRTDAANPATQGFMVLGDESNGHGELLVDGAGSLVDVRYLDIGQANSASGSVTVSNGGEVQIAEFSEVGAGGDGDNFLTVEDAGSRYETGGDLSVAAGSSSLRVDGEMRIRDGGAVVTGGNGFIGRASTNVGRVDLGGPGAMATWDVAGNFYMSGSTNVSSSGGSQSSGSSTLNLLENGRLTVDGDFYLKDRGTINLTGGELIANDLIFLDFTGTNYTPVPTVNWDTGLIRYTEGKTFSASDIDTIFSGGPALLDAGKHLAFDGLAVLGGPIEVDGGSLSIGSISTSSFDEVEFDSGTLNFTNSGIVVTNSGLFGSTLVIDEDETINVTNSAFVQADGLLNVAEGNFSSGATINSGTIVIAQGTADFGSLNNTNGDLVLVDAITTGTINGGDITIVNTNAASALALTSGSSIAFGIETAAGADDLLQVDDTASLAGSLVVSAADVSGIGLGDEYDLILADTVTGTFDNIALPTLGGGLEFDVLYEASRVALSVVAINLLAGDYNGNGVVDAADYTVWADNFGSTAALAADGNGNGVVDAADYTIWADNFGTSAAASQGLTLIPEPTSLALLAVGVGLTASRRRRSA
ncbi:MAG: PEP-CTERM sorting domain-containing protein [Planctomycetota bacterium]